MQFLQSFLPGPIRNFQAELHALRAEGEAGGGLVRVTLDGRYKMVDLVLDPACLPGNPSEKESQASILADLIKVAHARAFEKIEEKMQTHMREYLGNLGKK